MGLLNDNRNSSIEGSQSQKQIGFRMQDIKDHMMEQLDAIQVYDNINTTKDAMRQAIEKKSRDLSNLKASSRASLQ